MRANRPVQTRREVMSHNSGTKRAVARGGMIFGAVTLLVSGVFSILMGVVAVANRAFFVTVGNYTYAVSLRGWGWGHIIGGALVPDVRLRPVNLADPSRWPPYPDAP